MPTETHATFVKKAAHGGVLMAASQILLSVASYVVAAVLARALGPAQFGVYGIVYSFLLSVELIGRLGVPQAVGRLVAEKGVDTARLEASAVTITFASSLVFFTAVWLGAPALAELFNIAGDGAYLFRVAALDIPFYGLVFALQEILGGRREYAAKTMAMVVYCTAKVVGVAILWATGPTIAGALLLNVAASVLAFLYLATRVGRASLVPDLTAWRPIVALAIPVAFGAVGTQLLGVVDLWALSAIGTAVADEVKGYYVAATTLARLPNLAAFVFTAVLIPSVGRAVGMGDRALIVATVRGAYRFLALVLVPACVLLAIEAEPVMTLLFSAAYTEGAGLLQILIFAHGLFHTIFFTLMSVLVAINAQRVGALIALVAVPFALLCNLVLVPAYGAQGAAMAALVPAALASVAAATIVRRRLGPLFEPLTYLKIVLATAAVAVAALLVETEGLLVLVELAVFGLAALGLAALMGVVTKADLQAFLPAKPKPAT